VKSAKACEEARNLERDRKRKGERKRVKERLLCGSTGSDSQDGII